MITTISHDKSIPGEIDYDVVIAGAGAVGMALALALNRLPHHRILILEALASHGLQPLRPAADQGRILALSWSSIQTLSALGIWPALSSEATPISAIHVSQRGWLGNTLLQADTLGLEALGWVVREPVLRWIMAKALRSSGVAMRYGTRLTAASPDMSRITLHLHNESKPITTSLLVGADGTDSSVRAMFDLPANRRSLPEQALVFSLHCAADCGTVAYERFLEEGVLGVLPLGSRHVGCTYVADAQRVERLASQPEPGFLQAVDAMMGGRLRPMALLGETRCFGLPWLMAQTITAPRTVLIGNAAHTMHPVAAQGFNLGLRDVAALALALAKGHDPGDQSMLACYARERLADYRQTACFLQALLKVYGMRLPGLAVLRGLGLGLLDVMQDLGDAVSLWGMGAGRPYLPALWLGGTGDVS